MFILKKFCFFFRLCLSVHPLFSSILDGLYDSLILLCKSHNFSEEKYRCWLNNSSFVIKINVTVLFKVNFFYDPTLFLWLFLDHLNIYSCIKLLASGRIGIDKISMSSLSVMYLRFDLPVSITSVTHKFSLSNNIFDWGGFLSSNSFFLL